jgi:hypothetical protein
MIYITFLNNQERFRKILLRLVEKIDYFVCRIRSRTQGNCYYFLKHIEKGYLSSIGWWLYDPIRYNHKKRIEELDWLILENQIKELEKKKAI